MGVCPRRCSIPSDSAGRGFGPIYACVEDHNPISCRRCLRQPVHGPSPGTSVSPCSRPCTGTLCSPRSTMLVSSGDRPVQGRLLHAGSRGFPLADRHLAAPGAVAESGGSQEVAVTRPWVWKAGNCQPPACTAVGPSKRPLRRCGIITGANRIRQSQAARPGR